MAFPSQEKAQWHKDRKSAAEQIKADRIRDQDAARREDEVAICLHCSNPFASGEGQISADASICYVCLD
jgi:hypothetical protein